MSVGMFMAEFDALQALQHSLLATLEDLTGARLTAAEPGGANEGFGTFAEADALRAAYERAAQGLANEFTDLKELAHSLVSALGDGAKKYEQTESDIAESFNSILAGIGA
jgi:hypothetical protein